MATVILDSGYNRSDGGNSTILWAVVASVTLHILLAYVIPAIQFEDLQSTMSMSVELAPAPAPEEPHPNDTASTQPEAPPPPPIKKQEYIIKPDARPMQLPVPTPITEPAASIPTETMAQESESIAHPTAAASESKSESKEESRPAASASDQAKPVGPAIPATSPVASDERNQYGDMLTRHIDKYKQYPRIAQMRNWEGDVLLELQLDANGNLTSSRVHKSSGRESLDNQAMEMVKKASPFPLPPASMRGRSFTIMVPVKFRLDN